MRRQIIQSALEIATNSFPWNSVGHAYFARQQRDITRLGTIPDGLMKYSPRNGLVDIDYDFVRRVLGVDNLNTKRGTLTQTARTGT